MWNHRLCPICNTVLTIRDAWNPTTLRSQECITICQSCGNYSELALVRTEPDLNNDLGRYRFKSIYNIYGIANVNMQRGVPLIFVIDGDYLDSFLNDIVINRDIIDSVQLSYFDKTLKKINKIELTQFL